MAAWRVKAEGVPARSEEVFFKVTDPVENVK
jgi:hypothetical protein